MIRSTDVGIQTGIEMVKEMSLTKWIRMEIEAREKARRDRLDQLEYARDEGHKEGHKEGQKEGQERVNMLYAHLLQDERLADLKRATEDAEFCEKLLDEYHIK